MSAIVIVSSTAGVLDELRSAARTSPPAGGVVLIAPTAPAAAPSGEGVRVIALAPRPESRARRRLERHVVGRTLLRLSPWDGGRVLARAVSRSPDARAAIVSAGALIAADRDAVLSVWRAARHVDASVPALYSLAAGTALIRRG